MARNSIWAAVMTATLIASAQAGEIKIHQWPAQFVPQEVATVPVRMDIGYYVVIPNQDQLRIKLQQVSIREYEGCTDMVIIANFSLALSCQITPTGKVPGDYTCSISPGNLDSPGGTARVCAKLANADLTKVPGGTTDVHVANVTIKVVPRF